MCLCGSNTGIEDLCLTNFSSKPENFEKFAGCGFHTEYRTQNSNCSWKSNIAFLICFSNPFELHSAEAPILTQRNIFPFSPLPVSNALQKNI